MSNIPIVKFLLLNELLIKGFYYVLNDCIQTKTVSYETVFEYV